MKINFISVTEIAKLLRKALKESFSNIKFSVVSSSYSGGASIDVRWIDGPSVSQVKAVTGPFEGAYFDGYTEYQGYHRHQLDGIDVIFGAHYISVDRANSDDMVAKAITDVVQSFGGCEPISVEDYRSGRANRWMSSGGCDMWRELNQYLYEMSDRANINASPTLARVTFVSGRENRFVMPIDISTLTSRNGDVLCMDCGVDTNEIEEYYMLHHELWYSINRQFKGMLCLLCVERRLGRDLTSADFLGAYINSHQAKLCPAIARRLARPG